jgi:hypothetical protein
VHQAGKYNIILFSVMLRRTAPFRPSKPPQRSARLGHTQNSWEEKMAHWIRLLAAGGGVKVGSAKVA